MQGKKTYVFFVLALVIWVANYFGFAGFEMSAELSELYDVIVIVGGLVLRKLTKTPAAF